MELYLTGLISGIVLAVLGALAFLRRRPPEAFQLEPGPVRPPAARPRASQQPEPDQRFGDALTGRLYEMQDRILSWPLPSTPEDLARQPLFLELVDVLCDPALTNAALLRYVEGQDLLPACAALAALGRRPRDPALETLFLARLNGFHPWHRHFKLGVLEAWRPDDPTLAGRVLLCLDESWQILAASPVLDGFLRRRAAVAPPSLRGFEWPPGVIEGELRKLLGKWVDPAFAEPLLEELDAGVAEGEAKWSPSSPRTARPPAGVGRVTRPGCLHATGLLACPSADAALERVLAALAGSPRRSVLVTGEAGVGKTSLVRRAADRLSRQGWSVYEAGATQLSAGMSHIGSLEGRLGEIVDHLAARPQMLWVMPDFHQLLWAGRHMQSPTGLLEMLVPAIESGQVLVLGETRLAALEHVLAERPEVERLFEIVRLDPPRDAELETLLDAWAANAAGTRGVEVPRAIRAEAAALARQYLQSQPPPGGVLRLLSGAVSRAAQRGPAPGGAQTSALRASASPLGMDDLIESLADLTSLPLDVLDERCALDLDAVRRRFESRVIGQREAVDCLVERLALLKAGVSDPNRPIGVFLFVGGSGTGKTELARTLAEYLFGSAERLLRLDMSELQGPQGFERLLGDARELGGRGNSLAERVRRQPFSVVLLDEFDRAQPDVWNVFLQVFDAGRLTDHRGEIADFRHTIIVLTSNLGAASGEAPLGLTGDGGAAGPGAVRRAVERTFRPELLNRLDRVVIFRPLTREVMRQILRKELAEAFARRGLRRRDWAVEMEESAIDLLVERGFSPTLGARPLRRALESLLLTPLAAAIVDRSAPEGDQFLFVRADGDALAVEFVDPDAPAPMAAMPGAPAPSGRDLASILYEARGTADEAELLQVALLEIRERVRCESWVSAKQALLLESAAPGFWERADRFERLGRAEYMDRIESGLRSAGSLLERLHGGARPARSAYPREMVRRLAQQLYLLDAACAEAIETGPRDAFLSVEPSHEDVAPAGATRDFARRLAAMYEAWARARGMRLARLAGGEGEAHVFAISGFAAYRLLAPEAGLHVLEWDEPGGRGAKRATVRVRVEPQPPIPAREGLAGLRRQAEDALGRRGPLPTTVARRYREQPSPLVKDLVRGWRTGRIERVLSGDFDVVPRGD